MPVESRQGEGEWPTALRDINGDEWSNPLRGWDLSRFCQWSTILPPYETPIYRPTRHHPTALRDIERERK
jgi:hypothetical protein